MQLGPMVAVDDLRSMELGKSRPVIYDRDIGLRLLFRDESTGAEHYVAEYPPGLVAQAHRHTAAHTVVVLDGQMQVNHEVIGPGSYCHFPAGEVMRHAPVGEDPCLFVVIFHGPFDVEPSEG
ncbi:MAG TPA: cupin domain-containing protein [Acidimicrobiia bacterium]|nr:cupin domain-containing protein [Acidimicrobiia bacterium]